MYQNVTLKLDKDLLKRAKTYAAARKTSLSQLMKDSLQNLLQRSEGYERAQKLALSLLKKGIPLGGGPYVTRRQDLHER